MVIVYELLGTLLLVYAIISTGGNTIGVCMTFFLLLQILGPVTGAHMNPAISVGVYVREQNRENIHMLWKIILS